MTYVKEPGLRWRPKVKLRTIMGGLALLLLVAIGGCSDAQPDIANEPTVSASVQVATPQPSITASPSAPLVDAREVEVVYASSARPISWNRGEYGPLWGDLDADARIINRLLRAIDAGAPVDVVEVNADGESSWTSYSSLVINLRFLNGTTWSVQQLIKCDLTSDGRKTNCLPVPDHWELLHRDEVVVSTALTEWFQQVQEYMPSVEHSALPDPIRPGEPFAISGAGYHEGDRVELSIEFVDGSELPLGEVSLDHGAFRWDGELPRTAPSGYAIVYMQVFEGTEKVGGLSVSTTVESSTAAAATTPSTALAELAGEGTWVLESLDGRPVINESAVTLRIGDSWFDGLDGCNSYGGRSQEGTPVAGADGVFSVPSFGVTDMLCPEPEGVMAQADAYLAALVRGERFRIKDDRLEILDGGGMTRLIFVRRAPLPGTPVDLEGTAWRLLIQGDATDSVRAPTLAFLDDRLVTGATACRSYVATYRASEGTLRFPGRSMLSSPQSWQSCAEQERSLESEFGDFLTWAREYSVGGEGGASRLSIWSIRGKTLTFEPLPQAVEDISDTDWSLMAFVELRPDSGAWHHRTTEVIQGTGVTIEFDEHGIGGFMGCNSFRGPAEVEDGLITVDRQSSLSTAKQCEEPAGLMEQEERYLSLVQRATRYGIYGDGLFLQVDEDVFMLFQFQARPG